MELLICFFSKFMDVERVALGSGQSGASALRKLIFLVFCTKAFLKGHKGTRYDKSQNEKKKLSILYVLWIFLCLLDKNKNLDKLRKAVISGKLVLVDRWIQDIDLKFADAPRLSLYKDEKGILGLVARFEESIFRKSALMQPSQIVVLDISARNSVLRKPEDLTLEQAERSAKDMLNFKWSEIAPTTVVDGNLNQEEVLKSLTSIIFSSFRV